MFTSSSFSFLLTITLTVASPITLAEEVPSQPDVDSYNQCICDHAEVRCPSHTGRMVTIRVVPAIGIAGQPIAAQMERNATVIRFAWCDVDSGCCCNKGYCKHMHNCCSVHVDGHTCWKYEACDLLRASKLIKHVLVFSGRLLQKSLWRIRRLRP